MVHFNLNECLICHGTIISLGRERKKKFFLHIYFSNKHTKEKKKKQRAPTNQKNIIFIILVFNRTNSLIALLCTGTCTVCRTWLDLVSMKKFYTNFFSFRYPHWIKIFCCDSQKKLSEKVLRWFPSNCWCYCFTCIMLYVS